MRAFRILGFAMIALSVACSAKKAVKSPEPAQLKSEIFIDEPIQTLARNLSEKIRVAVSAGKMESLEIVKIDSHDLLPPKALSYFQDALSAQLVARNIPLKNGAWKLAGDFSKKSGQLVFDFVISGNQSEAYKDSAGVPDDDQLRNTVAQFTTPDETHAHAEHKETKVPTPLAQLPEAPLDIAQNCPPAGICSLLILYSDRLVELFWEKGEERIIPLPPTSRRSRAPSGKILTQADVFVILSNNLAVPVTLDRHLRNVTSETPLPVPLPEPESNTYIMADGRFYDFELIEPTVLAVIDSSDRLAIAEQGKLVQSIERVGGALSVDLPSIYTSSPVLPGEPDALIRFTYVNGVLQRDRSLSMDGSITGISVTDLNQDGLTELLVVLENSHGVFIDVREPF